ncbi:major facilitator superfamily domain-containing protein [Aspergillus ambiguus]|uniref:MFS transporter n=1 Tax=Aspergillus ambiguus TaxID=176160 RepID=UPI003CCE34A9
MAGESCDEIPGPDHKSIGRSAPEEKPPEDIITKQHIEPSNAPYSSFTRFQKAHIVFAASWAAFIAPMTAHIYFPALNTLSHDLHVSNGLINLTITSYMIFQGLMPMMLGGLADQAGRRPVFIVCLAIYIVANIGLALQNNYISLLVLRCLQSAGISCTIALSSGVVADIAIAAERGSYMGFVSGGANLGPSIGPTIGGLLSRYLGWRAIFWFSVILAGLCLVQFLLFFPETGRKVVGDGSILPPGWNRPLVYWCLKKRTKRNNAGHALGQQYKLTLSNVLRSLSIMFEKEIAIILIATAMVQITLYDVCAALPSMHQDIYGLNDLQIGLCYLPYGIGGILTSYVTGKMLDWNYRRHARRSPGGVENFSIERARGEIAVPLLILGAASTTAWGWTLHFRVHLAAPSTILFGVGWCTSGLLNILRTLMIDLYPDNATAVTASGNLVRCLVGAGATGVVDPMLRAMGRGWCFTLVAAVMLGCVPLFWVVMRCAPRWRGG